MIFAAETPPLRGAVFTVINTNHTGPGSLRQAIFDANTNAGADSISFNIPSGGLTISLTNPLPALVEPVQIDATTQPGFVSAPVVELNGSGAGAGADGLRIGTSNSLVRGLVINRFNGDGIEVINSSSIVIEGNIIGLNEAGTSDFGNGREGILLTNSLNCVIAGVSLSHASRNVVGG
jgi:hypothetical protein